MLLVDIDNSFRRVVGQNFVTGGSLADFSLQLTGVHQRAGDDDDLQRLGVHSLVNLPLDGHRQPVTVVVAQFNFHRRAAAGGGQCGSKALGQQCCRGRR